MARSPNSPSSNSPSNNPEPRLGSYTGPRGPQSRQGGRRQDDRPSATEGRRVGDPIGVSPDFQFLPEQEQEALEGVEPHRGADFLTPEENRLIGQGRRQEARKIISRGQEPRYKRGQDDTLIFEMQREDVLEIQKDLASAGLLAGEFKKGEVPLGTKDPTYQAWNNLLGYANFTGQTWEDSLSDLMTSDTVTVDDAGNIVPAEQEGQEPGEFVRGEFVPRDFTPDSFMPTDHAELTQRIRQQFRKQLGRPPSEREIGHYMASLSKAEREAYEANVAASREEFEAQESARERRHLRTDREKERQFYEEEANRLDEPGGFAIARPPDEREMPPLKDADAVPDVNPIARYREQFREDYSNTLARQRKLQSAEQMRGNLMDSLLSMDQAIARG